MLQEVHNDICARLPHGVIVHTELGDGHLCEINQTLFGNKYRVNVEPTKRETFTEVIPYLRPMSSMTEEEITEIYEFARPYIIEEIKHGAESDNPDRKVEIENGFLSNAVIIDELNKRHIDYHGLIQKGLAIEAPKGMYN